MSRWGLLGGYLEFIQNLYKSLEIAIKYKYFKPVYTMFGKNISLEEIKKLPIDNVLDAYLIEKLRIRNFLNPTAANFDINVINKSETTAFVTIKIKMFTPFMNNWTNLERNVKLQKVDNKWYIVDSSIAQVIQKSISEEISTCNIKLYLKNKIYLHIFLL